MFPPSTIEGTASLNGLCYSVSLGVRNSGTACLAISRTSLAPICQSSLFYTFGLLKDYMICLAGSRSDLIPVQAVQVSVEATGELAAQRYEYRQLKATWLHEDPTDKPSSNPCMGGYV